MVLTGGRLDKAAAGYRTPFALSVGCDCGFRLAFGGLLSRGMDCVMAMPPPTPPPPPPLLISPLKLLRLLWVSGEAPFGESGLDESSESAPDSEPVFSSCNDTKTQKRGLKILFGHRPSLITYLLLVAAAAPHAN